MRDFNVKLNTAILNENIPTQREQFSDEEMNELVMLSSNIMEVFEKNKTNMLTAYTVLTSLSESIYVAAVFGDINE